jgi:hypothetical protein
VESPPKFELAKDVTVLVAKANECNRKLNQAAIRHAELQGAERKAPRTASRRRSTPCAPWCTIICKKAVFSWEKRHRCFFGTVFAKL